MQVQLRKCNNIEDGSVEIKEQTLNLKYAINGCGKTTLLNNLTGSTAKVAAYAFTTKEINAGYFTSNGKKIQVLDVPGTLARQDKLNNIELQAELVRTEVANLIIYVFDLSEQSGYSMQKQEQLFHKIGSVKPVFIYLAKEDITDQEKMKNFAHKHYSLKELKEKIASGIKLCHYIVLNFPQLLGQKEFIRILCLKRRRRVLCKL